MPKVVVGMASNLIESVCHGETAAHQTLCCWWRAEGTSWALRALCLYGVIEHGILCSMVHILCSVVHIPGLWVLYTISMGEGSGA